MLFFVLLLESFWCKVFCAINSLCMIILSKSTENDVRLKKTFGTSLVLK